MAAVRVTQQQYQQFIDKMSGLEARMATLQTHAEAQQEQIRVAEIKILEHPSSSEEITVEKKRLMPRSRARSEIQSTIPARSKRSGNRYVDELSNVAPILLVTKQLQKESYVFSEVEHLFL